MTKIKQQKRGLPPLDLRTQDHYEELLTISEVAQLSGFTKQFIYRLTKSNSLRYCSLGGITHIKYRHLRAWFVKLTSNKDCPLCPASFSLSGLMGYTKMGRCISTRRRFADWNEWSLRNILISNERAYYQFTRDCAEAIYLHSIGRVCTSTRRKGHTLISLYTRLKRL